MCYNVTIHFVISATWNGNIANAVTHEAISSLDNCVARNSKSISQHERRRGRRRRARREENGASNKQCREKQPKQFTPLSHLEWDDALDHGYVLGTVTLWPHICFWTKTYYSYIPTQETWVMMRDAYRRIVGPEWSSILPSDEKNGFKVPYKADYASGNKERGVFAAAPIEKGTLLWTSHKHQSARFYHGDSFRQVLKAIRVDLTCDFL